jgi:hypothetical protein
MTFLAKEGFFLLCAASSSLLAVVKMKIQNETQRFGPTLIPMKVIEIVVSCE